MSDNNIVLKTIRDLFGKEFYIPNYQRGYRWNKQQAFDLLDDIQNFIDNSQEDSKYFYLLQPLVVCWDEEEKHWRVVDGQQRLTTIFLICKYLSDDKSDDNKNMYSIEYETRKESAKFLDDIENKTEEDGKKNVDFYHMYHVYAAITEWFENKKNEHNFNEYKDFKKKYKKYVLYKLDFIWDQINIEMESDIFTRLNGGRIPLSDAELIKGMFVNRKNFSEGLSEQQFIANEWYDIENKLQNDEFWFFLHRGNYTKPTRIDFILELICMTDKFELEKKLGKKYSEMMKDDHGISRYFNELFKKENKKENISVNDSWDEVKRFFDALVEWYNDCRLYHYMGYLLAVKRASKKEDDFLYKCVKLWNGKQVEFAHDNNKIKLDRKNKESFIKYLKKEILHYLKKPDGKNNGFLGTLTDTLEAGKKPDNIAGLSDYLVSPEYHDKAAVSDYLFHMKFEEPDDNTNQGNGKAKPFGKRDCVNILLLHNIETMIRYNAMIVNNKIGLPYFKRFPFHLYNRDNWEVEHIRSNSGDRISTESDRLKFLCYAKEYFKTERANPKYQELYELIKEYMDYINHTDDINFNYNDVPAEQENDANKRKQKFNNICNILDKLGGEELDTNERNRIWNFTLLDGSTNSEYGNNVFPYKRDYIAKKEKGIILRYYIEKNNNNAEFKYGIRSVSEKKNELVKMIMAYENNKANDDQKKAIIGYVNKIDIDNLNETVNSNEARNCLEEAKKAAKDILQGSEEPDYNKYHLEKIKKKNKDSLRYKYVERTQEAPFILDITRNIFTKYYSQNISTMLHWTEDDAKAYWKDIYDVLEPYFNELNKSNNLSGGNNSGKP